MFLSFNNETVYEVLNNPRVEAHATESRFADRACSVLARPYIFGALDIVFSSDRFEQVITVHDVDINVSVYAGYPALAGILPNGDVLPCRDSA